MEEAISNLELEFKRVIHDLDYVNHRLETEFNKSDINNENDVHIPNLLRRINVLESRLLTTKKESQALINERKIVVSETASIILSNNEKLARIAASVNGYVQNDGANNDNDDGHDDIDESCKEDLIKTLEGCQFLINDASVTNQNTHVSSSSSLTMNENVNQHQHGTLVSIDDISHEKFEAVPISIRGKCKIEFIQEVFNF